MAEITNKTLLLPAGGMDLEATLFCGQSFSWEKAPNGAFAGAAGDRAALARQEGDTIRLDIPHPRAGDETFWRHYFALDTDYAALLDTFGKDPTLAKCTTTGRGIRVLNQPFFDTLLTFILSQNNHIPRITGIAGRLRAGFGPGLAPGIHGFPAPEVLAVLDVEDLAALRSGFRAKYLLDAARRVADEDITEEKLRFLADPDARKMLMGIRGVGPKVADCVLLYSLERYAVVPMDVWMKRAMARLFPGGMPPCAKGSEGIAQQFIFNWARDNLPRGG